MRTSFPRRRYTLRLLFVVVSLTGILSFVVAMAKRTLDNVREGHERLSSVIDAAHPTMAQRAVLENGHTSIVGSCKSGGFAMITYERVPDWLATIARVLGQESVPQITEVQVIASGFDDTQLAAISKITTLHSIQLDRTQVTDAGLADFCNTSNVKYIGVGELNQNIRSKGRDLAARVNAEHDYTPKWPPPN